MVLAEARLLAAVQKVRKPVLVGKSIVLLVVVRLACLSGYLSSVVLVTATQPFAMNILFLMS
jgi:hypothetical protein